MGKNEKFEVLLSKSEETRKALTDRVIQVVDKNVGGKLDFPDVSVITESMGKAVTKGTATVRETARQLELKHYSQYLLNHWKK